MDEISRTSGRTLGRVVPFQCLDRSSSNSERTTRAIVPAIPTRGETALRSRVVDVRKNRAVRNFFLQVAAEHPRACLNGISWNPAISNQTIPSGGRHLIVGDSLMRDLNEIFVSGETTVISFGGASVAQVIKMIESQNEDQLDTLIVMLSTNDISRAPVTPESRWEPLVVCLLNKLKEKYKPRLVMLCTISQNPEVGTPMNGNVTRRNGLIRSLIRSNPGELRLMDLENPLRMTDRLALTRAGRHFNTLEGRQWINDGFKTRTEEIEGQLRTTDALARTSLTGRGRVRSNVPEPLANRPGSLTFSDVRESWGRFPLLEDNHWRAGWEDLMRRVLRPP